MLLHNRHDLVAAFALAAADLLNLMKNGWLFHNVHVQHPRTWEAQFKAGIQVTCSSSTTIKFFRLSPNFLQILQLAEVVIIFS